MVEERSGDVVVYMRGEEEEERNEVEDARTGEVEERRGEAEEEQRRGEETVLGIREGASFSKDFC